MTVTIIRAMSMSMSMPVVVTMIVAAMTMEFIARLVLRWAAAHAEPHTERVVRGEERGEDRDPTEENESIVPAAERLRDDRILREEACREREACEAEAADQERPTDDAEALHVAEARHLAEVELSRHAVHDRAAAQEEECLEERVREDVIDRAEGRANAEAEEHVSELRDGGVRHHAFDVVLRHADRGGEERRDAADRRNERECTWIELEERVRTRDEVDARGDHGRRVDERRDRRRAFHRVRQPDIERELRALTKRAEHQAVRNRGFRPLASVVERIRRRSDRLEERVVFNRAVIHPDQEDAKREAEVADAVDDERLLRRRDGTWLRVVVANEEIARETDAFPTEVEEDEVAAHDERTHREEEDADCAEETRVALADVRLHVLGRVDRDERAEASDEEHPEERERIDVEGEWREERRPLGAFGRAATPRERDPIKEMDRAWCVGWAAHEEHQRQRERSEERERRDDARQLALHAARSAKTAEDGRDRGQQKDQSGP